MNEPDNDAPTVGTIARTTAPMGHVQYATDVTYPGEDSSRVAFFGFPESFGPVVMITRMGQTFVTDPGRFGAFSPEWVRRFFGPRA